MTKQEQIAELKQKIAEKKASIANHKKNADQYNAMQLATKIRGSVVLPEEPATQRGNVTVVWGSPRFN